MLARFYGWSHENMRNLPFNIYSTYVSAMQIIKSQEKLDALETHIYPSLKEKDRDSVFNKHQKVLEKISPKKAMTSEQLDMFIRANL